MGKGTGRETFGRKNWTSGCSFIHSITLRVADVLNAVLGAV